MKMKYIKQLFIAAVLVVFSAQASAALKFSTELRTARGNAIVTTVGAGAKLALFNGTQPATCGTATTELYRGTAGTPFGTVTNGVTTINVPADAAAAVTGTATWARIFKADGTTCVIDLNVGTTGTSIILNSTNLTSGVTVHFNSGTITEGNQ
jgi:hypothetical protein